LRRQKKVAPPRCFVAPGSCVLAGIGTPDTDAQGDRSRGCWMRVPPTPRLGRRCLRSRSLSTRYVIFHGSSGSSWDCSYAQRRVIGACNVRQELTGRAFYSRLRVGLVRHAFVAAVTLSLAANCALVFSSCCEQSTMGRASAASSLVTGSFEWLCDVKFFHSPRDEGVPCLHPDRPRSRRVAASCRQSVASPTGQQQMYTRTGAQRNICVQVVELPSAVTYDKVEATKISPSPRVHKLGRRYRTMRWCPE